MSQLRPAAGWVLLELEDSKYEGKLIIPDTAKDAPITGKVTAVGPPKSDDDPHEAKVGDRVLFPKYAGSDVEWEGKKYLLLSAGEIICYVEE
jgi:chaperonin GroES